VKPKPLLPYGCYQSSPLPTAPFQLTDDVPEYDYKFNIIMIGDSGVGKSSLLQRYADDKFSTNLFATVGCDWRTKNIQVGGKVINLSIWDTVGQERYRSLVTNYVREAHGAIIVYDITNFDSTEHLEDWSRFVNDHALPDTVKVLVGNKKDLEEHRAVEKELGKKLANKLGKLPFFETSAKDSYNVEAAFRLLAAKILESDTLIKAIEFKKQHPSIQLRRNVNQQEDGLFTTMCSQSWHWAKSGFHGTVSGVVNGWNYVNGRRRSRSHSSNRSSD